MGAIGSHFPSLTLRVVMLIKLKSTPIQRDFRHFLHRQLNLLNLMLHNIQANEGHYVSRAVVELPLSVVTFLRVKLKCPPNDR